MLDIALKKNDKQANLLIITLSVVVFVAVAFLKYVKFPGLTLGFNAHILALVNAVINGTVSVLLVAALLAVKQKKYAMHRNIMFTAMALSALFLVSYIGHHLLAPETPYGNPDSAARVFYFTILITHIILAAIILPFILFTAYRALTGEYARHKKMSKYTWPLWLYVSVTGVLVYLMISPYYTPAI